MSESMDILTSNLSPSTKEVYEEFDKSLATLSQTATTYGVSRDNLEGQYLNAHMVAMRAHCKLVLASSKDMKTCIQKLDERSNTELQKIRENGNQYRQELSNMIGILKKAEQISNDGIDKQYEIAILNAIKAIMPKLEEPLKEECRLLLENQVMNILKKKMLFIGGIILLFSLIGYGLRGCIDSNTQQIDLAITACELKPIVLPDGKKVCDLNTLSIYKGH